MATKQKLLELQQNGYCVLRAHLPKGVIEACRDAFWPVLLAYLKQHGDEPNRGPHRHFLPMPFDPPCFAPEFFFDAEVLGIVRGAMDQRVVADQWGCDVPVRGSEYQRVHIDYQRPLFEETADLFLPPYMLVVNFGLDPVTPAHGPIEIAPGTHRMSREAAMRSVECGQIKLCAVPLEIGDVLIRHPWTLHRGTPNTTDLPRAMITVRYVRRWYADGSREVNAIPNAVWQSLTPEQQHVMRFPVKD
ncbi:MAG TPA: phytanoyl-CoA dioxygenase family protein [Candidatus Angelobacter sp.]|nr:phytanoyl-CoA dioxygenase family protein [Candidatus Angelobacter sp.]